MAPNHCDDDREKANRELISAATAAIIRASIMDKKYENILRFSECQPLRRPKTFSIAQILSRRHNMVLLSAVYKCDFQDTCIRYN